MSVRLKSKMTETVRRQDGPPHFRTPRANQTVRQTRQADLGQPEEGRYGMSKVPISAGSNMTAVGPCRTSEHIAFVLTLAVIPASQRSMLSACEQSALDWIIQGSRRINRRINTHSRFRNVAETKTGSSAGTRWRPVRRHFDEAGIWRRRLMTNPDSLGRDH